MPRYLALDWDAGHAYLVAGTVAKGAVKMEAALTWPEEPPTAATAAGAGQRLKERLKEAGIAPAPLLVAVGRDRVVVKDVKFPPVPPHEEPAIVRFQAMKEFTDAVEDVVLDYVPAEAAEPTGEKKAFVVALRRDQLAALKAVAAAAGLKLAGITPRAFGAVMALKRTAHPAPEPGTAFAVLSVGDKGGEFVVARGEQIALTRQLSAASRNTDAALVGEIRRNLAVYAGQAGQQPVRALYVAEEAGPTLGVADRLRDTLAVPVYAFDPLMGLAAVPPGPRGGFAGIAGLVHLRARTGNPPIDFLHPREPKPPRDPNKRALTWAAAAAVLLLGGLGALGYARLAAKERELKQLRADKEDIDQQFAKLDLDGKRVKALDDWLKGEIVWLDELYDLAARFPDIEKLRLTELKANPHTAGKTGRFVGRIDLKGLVGTDDKPLNVLTTEMLKDGYYAPGPTPQAPNSTYGALRREFPRQWTTGVQVEKRPPAKYDRKLTAKAPPRKGQKGEKKAADAGGDQ